MRIVGHCTYCGQSHELRGDEAIDVCQDPDLYDPCEWCGHWIRCWEAARIDHGDDATNLKELVG